jgi:hypothetical protein
MLKALRTALRRIDRMIWRARTRWRHRSVLRAKAGIHAEVDKARRLHRSQKPARDKAHDALRQEIAR